MIPTVIRTVRCSRCGKGAEVRLPGTDPVVTDYDLHRIGWKLVGREMFCPKCIPQRPKIQRGLRSFFRRRDSDD